MVHKGRTVAKVRATAAAVLLVLATAALVLVPATLAQEIQGKSRVVQQDMTTVMKIADVAEDRGTSVPGPRFHQSAFSMQTRTNLAPLYRRKMY